MSSESASTCSPCTAIVTQPHNSAEDKGVGTAIAAKVIVIFCQGLAWGQLLLIPLDLSLSGDGNQSAMNVIYSIVYVVIFTFTAFIIPFTTFIYEEDPTETWGKRIGFSVLYTFGIGALWSAIIFISYIWLSKYTENEETNNISAPLYIMLFLSLVGWIFLSVFGGIGLSFLPYDLIDGFVKRPKVLSTEDAYEKKK